jgi:ferrous iron transport protein A
MTLSELKVGATALVEEITLKGQDRGLALRLEAMGFLPNKPVTVLRKAAFGGPLHIRVGTTTELVIRRQEADCVKICIHA